MSTLLAVKQREREFIIECIRLYRSLPALWNVKSKTYFNREKKNKAYKILLAKYREMYSDAVKDDVKRKFNALRSNYRKELNKQIKSMKSGASTDSELYEPSLYYFNEFSFLQDSKEASDSESAVDHLEHTFMNVDEIDEEQTEEIQVSFLNESKDFTPPRDAASNTHLKMLAAKTVKEEGFTIKPLTNENSSEKADEHNYWGLACAADLRKMDQTQQIYAKKAIAEILMEGQLGLLHRNSLKVNESQAHHS